MKEKIGNNLRFKDKSKMFYAGFSVFVALIMIGSIAFASIVHNSDGSVYDTDYGNMFVNIDSYDMIISVYDSVYYCYNGTSGKYMKSSSNCSETVQYAVDQLSNIDGGTLFFKTGTYSFNTTVTFNDFNTNTNGSLKITGSAAYGTVDLQNDGSFDKLFYFNNCNNVLIEHLNFDVDDGTGQCNYALYAVTDPTQYCGWLQINQCRFQGGSTATVYIDLSGARIYGTSIAGDGNGIALELVKDGCHVIDSSLSYADYGLVLTGQQETIRGCHFEDIDNAGIYSSDTESNAAGDYSVISNNVFSSADESDTVAIDLQGIDHAVIIGNSIVYYPYGINVTDKLDDYANWNIINSNDMKTAASSTVGITVQKGGYNQVNDNMFRGYDTGIVVEYLASSGKNVISGNVIHDSDYGIKIEGSTDYNIITDNIIHSPGIEGINGEGSHTIINNNIGHGGVVIPTVAPDTPIDGSVYVNTTTGDIAVYDGSSWIWNSA